MSQPMNYAAGASYGMEFDASHSLSKENSHMLARGLYIAEYRMFVLFATLELSTNLLCATPPIEPTLVFYIAEYGVTSKTWMTGCAGARSAIVSATSKIISYH